MNHEREFGPKIPTNEEVISSFKENGETSESIELYSIWLQNKQRECNESTSLYARLRYNIEVAELLIESNMYADARDYIDGGWNVIEFEGTESMYGADTEEEWLPLRKKLDELDSQIDGNDDVRVQWTGGI